MKLRLLACLLLGIVTNLAAHEAAPANAVAAERVKTWQAMLAKPSLAAAVAFDARGRLWRVTPQDGYLLVSHSDDLGATQSAPVRINAVPEAILGDGENRPKLVIRKGIVYVSWTRGLAAPMTGDIRFSRSLDDGKSFAAPLTINDNHDVISHRFDALVADDNGRVALAWLDKRDLQAAQKIGKPYAGAALYVAESRDGGQTFAANRKLADHSCECCRVALAQDRDGTPVAFWRHVFAGNIRDFALARVDAAGGEAVQRASEDNWQLNGCPHHGGDLAVDAQGSRHLAWFTGAPDKAGLYYRRLDAGQAGAPVPFGDADHQPGHPAILVSGDSVFLAWQEFDGKAMRIQTMVSHDRGTHWAPPTTSARTAHAADRPQLLSGRGKTWLAWNSADEGLRLWPLEPLEAGTAP